MNVCGVTLTGPETNYLVIAAISCAALLLAPLAAWIATHYQRADKPPKLTAAERKAIYDRATWRAGREETDDE